MNNTNKIKVVGYLAGIPAKNTNPEKPAIIHNFIQGVNAVGDIGIVHQGNNVLESDVGLLQGFVHEQSKNVSHLVLRKNVLKQQAERGKRTLIVDSNLFLYKDPKNSHHYLRYSFDGVFRSTGCYFDTIVNEKKWLKLKDDLNLNIKDYRTNGSHILICLQRNGGWSMRGLDVTTWLRNVISEIRKFSDRPIRIRQHPGDGKAREYLKRFPKLLGVEFVNVAKRTLQQDLQNAWACVTYNSSPGIASLLEGVPVFMTDPDHSYSQYTECANTKLKRLENPKMYDREKMFHRLAMSHWKFDETKDGSAWEWMRQFI